MPVFENKEKSWKLYFNTIEDAIGVPPQNESVQLLSIFKQIEWDAKDLPNFNLFLQQSEANNMPSYGGLGILSGRMLERAYDDFLLEVTQKVQVEFRDRMDSKDKALVDGYNRKIDTSYAEQKKLDTDLQKEWKEYEAMHQNDPYKLSRDQWNRSNPKWSLLSTKIRERKGYSDAILIIYAKYENVIARELSRARDNFDAADSFFTLPERKEWENDNSKWTSFKKQWFNEDIFRFKEQNINPEYEINSLSQESTTIATSWGGNAGWSGGWWNIGGGASGSTLNIEASTDVTAIKIKFKNLQDFYFNRSRWFDRAVIEKYGNLAMNYFGKNGKLNVIPISYIVGRGLELKITSTQTHTVHMEEHWRVNGSIGIGPFSFGANYSKDKIYSKFESQGNSYTLTDLSDICYVIGIRCYLPFAQTIFDILFKGNLG